LDFFHDLESIWRVGYYVDPLSVSLEYQTGVGRFDDPLRERVVFYGADCAITCIYETALPWKPHKDAGYAHAAEAPETDVDDELKRAELRDAERDREIAMRPFKMPAYLYDYAKVHAELRDPLTICDLDNISVSAELAMVGEIAALMDELEIPQLDRSVMTGHNGRIRITQAISGHLMRSSFMECRFPGFRALSRFAGAGYCHVLFEACYEIGALLVPPTKLTPGDADVIEAATNLRLIP
jgi:hypothetical protein